MLGVGRHLGRSSSSMPLLQQDQLGLVAQYTVVSFSVSPQLETSQPLCPTSLFNHLHTYCSFVLWWSFTRVSLSPMPLSCLWNMQPKPDE